MCVRLLYQGRCACGVTADTQPIPTTHVESRSVRRCDEVSRRNRYIVLDETGGSPFIQSEPRIFDSQADGASECSAPWPRSNMLILTIPAIAAAASACMPGMTWAYCFIVKAGFSWPRRSLMTFTGTPALRAIDACVCRRSWLCRRRHRHDYADIRVMPTSAGRDSGVRVIAVFGSA